MTPKVKEAIERCLSEHRGMIICEETCWCWDLDALLSQLAPEQAEPPAGEFTANARGEVCGSHTREAVLVNEACDRLDVAEQATKDLEDNAAELETCCKELQAENAAQQQEIERLKMQLRDELIANRQLGEQLGAEAFRFREQKQISEELRAENAKLIEKVEKGIEALLPLAKCDNQDDCNAITFAGKLLEKSE